MANFILSDLNNALFCAQRKEGKKRKGNEKAESDVESDAGERPSKKLKHVSFTSSQYY